MKQGSLLRDQDGRLSTYFWVFFSFMFATGCQPVGTVSPAPSPSVTPVPGPTPTSEPTGSPSPAPTSSPSPIPIPIPIPTTTHSPRPPTAANETVCAGSVTISGTDVSDYQAGTNWTKVSRTGAGFAFVKATEGLTFVNSDFSADWPAVSAAGMVRGAYHYFYPEDDPTEQADFYLTTVGNFSSTDLPPMLDWEEAGGVSTSTDVKNAVTWLERVAAATGKTPIIYASPDFINALGNPSELIAYPLYIANYGVTCPEVPPPWSSWVFWQSSDSGSISGVNGSVDLDTFNGSMSALKLFASTGVY
jgi:lysozyme